MAEKIWTALSNELAAAAAAAGNSVVAVLSHRHPSSGVLFRPDAVVTASDALRGDEDIGIIAAGGKKVVGLIAGRDPATDLAVVRLQESLEAPAARWRATAGLKVGELVLALGRTRRGNTVASAGILSGVIAGPWRTWRNGALDQFIRPDLSFYPGFCGGPLVADNGEFLGINTTGLHRTAITIPSSTVQRIAHELIEKGRIERPYLGLGMQPVHLPESLRTRLNLTAREALMVAQLEPGGPAEKAGVMLGDVLIELGSRAVADTENVQDVLRSMKAGQELDARLIRASALATLKIKLEARPER